MVNWLLEDVLKANAAKWVGALVALATAHSSLLQSWGINVDWGTLGGKITTALLLLIGTLGGHHVNKAIQGGTNASK